MARNFKTTGKEKHRGLEVGIPPHDLEAERSVLGALLIDPDSIVKVIEFLKPIHFYRKSHEFVYEAIRTLYERRDPADLITVPDELKRMKELDNIGGVSYLTDLVNSVPTAANIEHYGNIVRDHAIRRTLIAAAAEIQETAFSNDDVASMLDNAEQALFSVSQDGVKKDFVHISETLEMAFEGLDELSRNRGAMRGVPTGFKNLDKLLSGMKKEELIILAARPSVGKTSLALNIGQYAATTHKMGVVFFSLEMGQLSLINRLLSAQGDIDNWRINTGNLEPEDFERYSIASGELAEAPIYIDDTPGISVMEMRTKARRLAMEHQIDLILVDYLQLMKGRNIENRVQEVAEISQGLKNLARELKVPVLAMSQLSRAVEKRGGENRPQLSDLRDSGSIEQDADVVMFLYRPDEEDRENLNLLVAKHRNGPTGEIPLYFRGDRTRFYEMDAQHNTQ